MARIKIDLPETFSFSTSLTVRITDLNYGGHVGNDSVLSFVHEARVRYLQALGYTEMNLEGVSLILADAALIFRNEIYYGDDLLISVQAVEFSRLGFDLIYKIEKKMADQPMIVVAIIKTTMAGFDYERKKLMSLPEKVINKLK
ncbi:MAG TPA: thioesterase family protein [Puia sp.]|nr:thioesterase family protein [Puia sp.]